jgi:hypothetical protein
LFCALPACAQQACGASPFLKRRDGRGALPVYDRVARRLSPDDRACFSVSWPFVSLLANASAIRLMN